MEIQATSGRNSRAVVLTAGAILLSAVAAALLIPSSGSARAQAPPVNSGQPRILGTPIEGRRLTATTGSWSSPTPMTFSYRWVRCDAATAGGPEGVNCTPIAGATGRTYLLRSADVGRRLRVRVTATNADGSTTRSSNGSGVVQSAAAAGRPRNTAPPTIAGAPVENQTLTANNGSWSGAQPMTFAYQWRRCDRSGGSCANISGATARTYVVKNVDVGATLRTRVTARNGRGATSATSAPTSVVTRAEAPAGAAISVNDVSLPNRLLVDRVQFVPQPLRRRQTYTARFHVSDSRNHSVAGALVFVVALPFGTTSTPPEAATGPDGWVTFRMRPTVQIRFDRRGAIQMFVRARKPGERLIGGVSTRRLVNLGIR
jgi:hypothetical protein